MQSRCWKLQIRYRRNLKQLNKITAGSQEFAFSKFCWYLADIWMLSILPSERCIDIPPIRSEFFKLIFNQTINEGYQTTKMKKKAGPSQLALPSVSVKYGSSAPLIFLVFLFILLLHLPRGIFLDMLSMVNVRLIGV